MVSIIKIDIDEMRTPQLERRLVQYGISFERYIEMFLEQEGCCAICGSSEKLVFDHDHKCCPERESCGKCVRGLLCHRCNRLLGILEQEDNLLAYVTEYLNKFVTSANA